jgi:hypothetical protein
MDAALGSTGYYGTMFMTHDEIRRSGRAGFRSTIVPAYIAIIRISCCDGANPAPVTRSHLHGTRVLTHYRFGIMTRIPLADPARVAAGRGALYSVARPAESREVRFGLYRPSTAQYFLDAGAPGAQTDIGPK